MLWVSLRLTASHHSSIRRPALSLSPRATDTILVSRRRRKRARMREGQVRRRRHRCLHYNSTLPLSPRSANCARCVERAMSTVLCMRGMRAACLNPGTRRPRVDLRFSGETTSTEGNGSHWRTSRGEGRIECIDKWKESNLGKYKSRMSFLT